MKKIFSKKFIAFALAVITAVSVITCVMATVSAEGEISGTDENLIVTETDSPEDNPPIDIMAASAEAEWPIDINIAFPDSNFRAWVKSNVTGGSDELTETQANAVTTIDVRRKDIASLQGIEYFANLTELVCELNKLTSLSLLEKNLLLESLYCSDNNFTNLDVSGCKNLKTLECGGEGLISLDVSGCTELEWLDCIGPASAYMRSLTSLDVGNNTKLKNLYCEFNKLITLDLSNNIQLEELHCYYNQLTSLDLSNNVNLKSLACYDNQLTFLDVSNSANLQTLSCRNNNLTSLDISNNTKIDRFLCDNNQLESIELGSSTILYSFNCNNNKLTSLDVSEVPNLMLLWCENNQLYDIIGLETLKLYNGFEAANQKIFIPVTPPVSDTYTSKNIYPLSAGKTLSFTPSWATYNTGTEMFTTTEVDTAAAFETSNNINSFKVSGTIVFEQFVPVSSITLNKKQGSINTIINSIAPIFPIAERVKRYVGIPTTAAVPKQIS